MNEREDEHRPPPGGQGYGGGHEGEGAPGRTWADKARDEIAGWLGDEQARRRREWDRVRGRP